MPTSRPKLCKLAISHSTGCSRSLRRDAGLLGPLDEIVAAGKHLLEAAPGADVVALEARRLDAPEHVDEVDRASARVHVELVEPVVVGKAHLLAAAHTHAIDEALDALRVIVRMIDRERPLEMRRWDLLEEVDGVLQRVRHVVHLGSLRLAI